MLDGGQRHGAQVTEHGVGVPAAEEADEFFIDAGAEERRGASGP